MTAIVSLYGGPAHGKVLQWNGGAFIRIPAIPQFTVLTEPPSQDRAIETHEYRQSTRDRSVFVYQP